jgi:hypothetical protein
VVIWISDIRCGDNSCDPGKHAPSTGQASNDIARVHNQKRRQILCAISLGFVLFLDFRFETSALRRRPGAETLYGRFRKLYLDGIERLDTTRSFLFLWLRHSLDRSLAGKFNMATGCSSLPKRDHLHSVVFGHASRL